MPVGASAFYADALFFDALMRAIEGAQRTIDLTTFLFKTHYAARTRANEVADALIAAAGRGVVVRVALNQCHADPDVCQENYETGLDLAAGGCEVRLGPPDLELHAKVVILDSIKMFEGSHNLTRGGLTTNSEVSYYTEAKGVLRPVERFFRSVWSKCSPIAEVGPPVIPSEPLVIELQGATPQGAALELAFSVNHTVGVEAYGAVADAHLDLAGARMGPTVPPTARRASVVPSVEPGEQVCLAVRAYRSGTVIATSVVFQTTYNPAAGSLRDESEDAERGAEGSQAVPLSAPNLLSVARASDTAITVTWAFPGVVGFDRFVLEQRDAGGHWRVLAALDDPSARTWTGPPHAMNPALPLRVAVYTTTGQTAVSREVGMA